MVIGKIRRILNISQVHQFLISPFGLSAKTVSMKTKESLGTYYCTCKPTFSVCITKEPKPTKKLCYPLTNLQSHLGKDCMFFLNTPQVINPILQPSAITTLPNLG